MVKLLVVGSEGGLGRALCDRLGAEFDVVALGRRALDVTRRNDVMARVREIRPGVIFDAAGATDIDAVERDRWRTFLVNRDGAEHLSRAAAEVGALMVYPSTDLVYDGVRPGAYTEEDPPNPLSVYGDSKLAGELAVMGHAPRRLVLRTGWLFGAGGRSPVEDAIERSGRGEALEVYEDHLSQPTWYRDFVDAVAEVIRRGETGLWHIASEGVCSPLDAARETVRLLNRPVKACAKRRDMMGRPALRPRHSELSCKKLGTLGIRLPPWQKALATYLETRQT